MKMQGIVEQDSIVQLFQEVGYFCHSACTLSLQRNAMHLTTSLLFNQFKSCQK